MAEETQGQEAGRPQAPPLPQVIAELVVRMHADGKVTVLGPLDQKVLCSGMLAQALHAVNVFDPSKAMAAPGPKPLILTPGEIMRRNGLRR